MLDQQLKQRIDTLIAEHPVLLFMKGTADFPHCGFSAQAVAMLRDCGVSFHSINVLDDPELREGIKQYSDWPTVPQLYVQREFIGGCDIMQSMHQQGELQQLLAPLAAD